MSGLFFWKKKKRTQGRNRVQVDRTAALAHWRTLPSFHGMVLVIGQQRANEMIQQCDAYIQRAIRWMDYEEDAHELYGPMIAGFFDYETRMVLDIKAQINGLWGRCLGGEFATLLNRNNLDPFDWRIPTNPLEDDLWKGMNWVSSHDTSRESRRKILRLMMILHRDYDIRQTAAFDRANTELIGIDARAAGRMTNMGGAYPSVVGAQAIGEHIEALAMTMNLVPGDQSTRWDDLACFLYGAYIRAQTAADGNKRTSRAIFVATLRKGGRPIRVPDRAMSAILLGANWIR